MTAIERELARARPAPAPSSTAAESSASPAATVLALQRTIGNAAVGRLLQRDDKTATKPPAATKDKPKIVDIGGEKVEVANDAEKAEAERIIKDIKDKYAIEISTSKGVEAVKKHYEKKATEEVRKGVKGSVWKLKELKALERALAHFAPILGGDRESSSRAGTDQEVTTAGKVGHSITGGKLDDTTLGEFFSDQANFDMFDAGTDSTMDFSDNAKQLEGTAIHEIAHGLMKYALPDWVKGLDFWKDEDTASGKKDAEAPITDYGTKNAREDFSEAVMYYFLEPETLKKGRGKKAGEPGNPCPTRYELIAKFVKAWKPLDAKAGMTK